MREKQKEEKVYNEKNKYQEQAKRLLESRMKFISKYEKEISELTKELVKSRRSNNGIRFIDFYRN